MLKKLINNIYKKCNIYLAIFLRQFMYLFINTGQFTWLNRWRHSINCFTGGVTPWESNRVARAFCCRKELVMPAVTSGIYLDLLAYFSYPFVVTFRNLWSPCGNVFALAQTLYGSPLCVIKLCGSVSLYGVQFKSPRSLLFYHGLPEGVRNTAWLSSQRFVDFFRKRCSAAKWMRTWNFRGFKSNFFERRAPMFKAMSFYLFMFKPRGTAQRYQHLLQLQKMLIFEVSYTFNTLVFNARHCNSYFL